MARYTDAVCKKCRREGSKLFLKGERCNTAKCALDRRSYAPGQHGKNRVKVNYQNMDFNLEQNKEQRIIIEFLNLNSENIMKKPSEEKELLQIHYLNN